MSCPTSAATRANSSPQRTTFSSRLVRGEAARRAKNAASRRFVLPLAFSPTMTFTAGEKRTRLSR